MTCLRGECDGFAVFERDDDDAFANTGGVFLRDQGHEFEQQSFAAGAFVGCEQIGQFRRDRSRQIWKRGGDLVPWQSSQLSRLHGQRISGGRVGGGFRGKRGDARGGAECGGDVGERDRFAEEFLKASGHHDRIARDASRLIKQLTGAGGLPGDRFAREHACHLGGVARSFGKRLQQERAFIGGNASRKVDRGTPSLRLGHALADGDIRHLKHDRLLRPRAEHADAPGEVIRRG